MKKIIFALLRQILFWILFFDFTRVVFLLYHIRLIIAEKIGFFEIPGMFWYSLKLDLATTAYIMVIPFLLLLIQTVWSPKWFNYINKVYTAILVFAYSLSAAGEMGIYSEWKTKLTYKVIKYLSHPGEIYNSAETGTFIFLVILLVFLFLAGFLSYLKIFYLDIIREKRNWLFSFLFLVIMPPLLVITMRGGVQAIAITPSQSYYSRHNILNLTSVNNFFNLYLSIFENLPNFRKDPYVFFDQKKAKRIVAEIYHVPKDTTLSILKTKKPNIVILILESWSADLIHDLGGEPGITPEFRELEKNGILFDHIYASGSRSEQGMASIFSGFPAHPVTAITLSRINSSNCQAFPRY